MDNQTKRVLLKLMLTAGGDLGGKSVNTFLEAIEEGRQLTDAEIVKDPISSLVYNYTLNAEARNDIRDDLRYAIKQLQSSLNQL